MVLGLRGEILSPEKNNRTLMQASETTQSSLNKQENLLVYKSENPVAGVALAGLDSGAQCFPPVVSRMTSYADRLSLALACHMALLKLGARQYGLF